MNKISIVLIGSMFVPGFVVGASAGSSNGATAPAPITAGQAVQVLATDAVTGAKQAAQSFMQTAKTDVAKAETALSSAAQTAKADFAKAEVVVQADWTTYGGDIKKGLAVGLGGLALDMVRAKYRTRVSHLWKDYGVCLDRATGIAVAGSPLLLSRWFNTPNGIPGLGVQTLSASLVYLLSLVGMKVGGKGPLVGNNP